MKGTWVTNKKVLKIFRNKYNAQYLFHIIEDINGNIINIKTVKNKQDALDVGELPLEKIGRICKYLRENGFNIDVINVEEVKEVDLDIGISEEELAKIVEEMMCKGELEREDEV